MTSKSKYSIGDKELKQLGAASFLNQQSAHLYWYNLIKHTLELPLGVHKLESFNVRIKQHVWLNDSHNNVDSDQLLHVNSSLQEDYSIEQNVVESNKWQFM